MRRRRPQAHRKNAEWRAPLVALSLQGSGTSGAPPRVSVCFWRLKREFCHTGRPDADGHPCCVSMADSQSTT